MDSIKVDKSARPLSADMYSELRADILSGEIPDNSKLTEHAICKKYNVSRTPVREAFKRLQEDGLVEYISNRGVFVRGLSESEIGDMLETRAFLEIKATEWCISRITEEEIEDISAIFKHMEFYTKKGDIQKMIEINYAFHRLIYKASHDRLLEKTLLTYQNYCNYCCPPNYFARGFLRRTLEEHRQIYRAIINKDQTAAANAMKAHMDATIKRSSY